VACGAQAVEHHRKVAAPQLLAGVAAHVERGPEHREDRGDVLRCGVEPDDAGLLCPAGQFADGGDDLRPDACLFRIVALPGQRFMGG
jgi:hypothetical protein